MFFTCESPDPASACPTPDPQSDDGLLLSRARTQAGFELLWPCQLPAGSRLDGATVTGNTTRRQAEFVFGGAFDMSLRQANYAPTVSADPTGASRSDVPLFPNIPGILIERYDGSSKAQYHLLWQSGVLYYELQVVGPPQQRDAILRVARSLQPLQ